MSLVEQFPSRFSPRRRSSRRIRPARKQSRTPRANEGPATTGGHLPPSRRGCSTAGRATERQDVMRPFIPSGKNRPLLAPTAPYTTLSISRAKATGFASVGGVVDDDALGGLRSGDRAPGRIRQTAAQGIAQIVDRGDGGHDVDAVGRHAVCLLTHGEERRPQGPGVVGFHGQDTSRGEKMVRAGDQRCRKQNSSLAVKARAGQ